VCRSRSTRLKSSTRWAVSCSLVYHRISETVSYLEEKLDTVFYPPYTVIGIEKQGRIVGGWLFNDYNGYNVDITVALDTSLTPGMLKAVKAYLFEKMRVCRVTGRCRESNAKSALMMRRLGFVWEGRQPFYYGKESSSIYGYTHGQHSQTASGS
jgi:RimJ/RimL family protein N-acetyltransferase